MFWPVPFLRSALGTCSRDRCVCCVWFLPLRVELCVCRSCVRLFVPSVFGHRAGDRDSRRVPRDVWVAASADRGLFLISRFSPETFSFSPLGSDPKRQPTDAGEGDATQCSTQFLTCGWGRGCPRIAASYAGASCLSLGAVDAVRGERAGRRADARSPGAAGTLAGRRGAGRWADAPPPRGAPLRGDGTSITGHCVL